MSITQAMLEAVFPQGIPPRIEAMVQPAVADELLADFKVGPVLAFCGDARPVRVAISDQGEAERWTTAVLQQWPGSRTEDILSLAGPGVRRMVDTDGSDKAEIYLDKMPITASTAR